MAILDYERLAKQADQYREQYRQADPYPHVVIDDFINEDIAEGVRSEFSSVEEHWKFYRHYNEAKLAITDLDDMPTNTCALMQEFNSPEFVDFIESLTGNDDLIPDPALEGAGMHMIRRDGFLNVHADFQTHTKNRTWSRQVNLLLYLNRDWEEEWRGHLEIWNPDMTALKVKVLPVFNRCVIFNTLADAFHGHPDPLMCPEDEARKSVAVYYYREEGRVGRLTPTDYQPRPDDPLMTRLLIKADYMALKAYTFIKGHTPISDKTMSKILKRFS